ncbi:UDP-glycosyltransferase 87A2 [Sesamum indicum]|uniref:UDP-glycosyltransferase 87A2 n=1 Tax=Sesamum indicum TaxID=4182 RepID=A0A6I9T931_SESIN|nr:UDP-glycosyltransferase 87A2 [Sesamum indicum]
MANPMPNCHVVAMPYPGRGHINPMLNLCRLILSSRPDILVSFIVTDEWLGFLTASPPPTPLPPNFRFLSIPNVIPSEIGRAKDFRGFYEATVTKMEAPVEQLLDRPPSPMPRVIIYDTYLSWVVAVGNRRNIPVASLYTMSATVFSIFHHFNHIRNRHSSPNLSDEQEKEQLVNYIPGVPSMRAVDLPTPFGGKGREVLPRALEAINLVPKAQYLLFTSVYELESQVLDDLAQKLPLKIYSLGLAIPYLDVETTTPTKPDYMRWLDAQPVGSVLYISQGSFLSVSNAQLDEIIAGVRCTGVRFLWVGRGEHDGAEGNGIVVPWCDQLKVLCHPSVGGFWSHCGWNSTKEGAFAGVPMLTFPIFWDQVTNSKMIVDDWKMGLRVKKDDESVVTRDEVARIVLRLMDSESEEGKERMRRVKEIRDMCRNACAGGGSSETDILAFVRDISGC